MTAVLEPRADGADLPDARPSPRAGAARPATARRGPDGTRAPIAVRATAGAPATGGEPTGGQDSPQRPASAPGGRIRLAQLVELSRPRGMFPLLVLLGLSAVERFDATALGVLAPEIKHAFGLSDAQFVPISTLTGVLPLLLSLPLGVIADRTNRVWLSRIGGIVWGVTAVATGLAPAIGLLVVARLAGGSGQLVNEVAHPSLLSDWYRPRGLPVIFGTYTLGTAAIGLLAGPIAGGLGAGVGWRATFVILGLPTFALVAVLWRLEEPVRGSAGEVAPPPDVVGDHDDAAGNLGRALVAAFRGFGTSYRELVAVRSLRRTWWAAAFFGGGVGPFATYLSLFFDEVYHVSAPTRGVISAVYGFFGLVGVAAGTKLALNATTADRPERLPLINGLMIVQFGAFVMAMAIAPSFALSLLAVCVLSIGAAGFVPAYRTMVALVVPARLRSQAFAWSLTWLLLGAVISSFVITSIRKADGEHVALALLGIIIVIGGAIACSARFTVPGDIAAAGRREAAVASDALLCVRGLDVAYAGGVQVLFGVDLDVRRGEVIALLGTNGAGKSTLLRAISGLVDPVGGAVSFDGRDVTHLDPVAKAKLGIIQVPGGKGVFPGLSVAENLRIAGWLHRRDQAHLAEATAGVLQRFPILRDLKDEPAANLSGGQQQMLTIGQALLAKPSILMIDELSLGLAPVIVEQLLGTVRQLAAEGVTIILVEQSVNVALTIADTAYFMEKGEVRFHGPTAELLDRPDVLRSVFLEGVGSMAATPVRSHRPAVEVRPERPVTTVLAARDLTKRYGGVQATDHVSFDLHEGRILGIIGPNGAGKTTLFDLLCGYAAPDAGTVTLLGEDVTGLTPDLRAWRGLGRSFQDARLFPALTVAETIALSFEKLLEVRDPVAAALHLPAVADAERVVAERCEELIELMGLDAFRDKFVGELSTGSRRIVDLACILASEPKVILFDEPSSGIAQRETEALGPLLLRIREATGASLLVIEHDMPLITSISDEILALDLGHVVLQDRPDTVLNDPRVVSSYLGSTDEVVSRSGAAVPPKRPSHLEES